MHLFYTPDISGQTYTLNEEESKHCVRVLRLAKGATICLIDGRGNLYTAQIADAQYKRCIVSITDVQREYGKRQCYLHMAVAPTKNMERYEWFLEKATEIGVDEITPLLCEHSERKVVKDERSEKVVTAAVKQSVKAYHPLLHPITSFKQLVQQPFSGSKFIAHCFESPQKQPLKTLLSGKIQSALVLVGPEGDFSPEEVDFAKQHGFVEVSLGSSRLRTETAGVAACHTVNLLQEE
ncbi:MAG: 16S rRNA (uracil(1498)-N(3))-methyltransferase [Prevotellaceae bacterium]|jgi:16S rRNA (uracil1498-N3)-methyltransferase|nr:16S rRNA (uracil(1498)-N(3))-methyltransferase [Prevotellaceae bacterium]